MIKNCKFCNKEFKTDRRIQQSCSISCGKRSHAIKDPNPFDIMTKEEGAYLLGLIYADGCLSLESNGIDARVTIALKDKDLIEALHPYFCPDRKLYKQTTHYNTMSYSIINKNTEFIKELRKLGITERKSLTLTYPEIPQELESNFIRGYFDGDGSVHIYKKVPRNYLGCSFTSGSEIFLKTLTSKIKNFINIEFSYQTESRHSGDQIRLRRTNDIKVFAKWLYEKNNFFLKRKYQIFLDNNCL